MIDIYILHAADNTKWLRLPKGTPVPVFIQAKAKGNLRMHWNHRWWMRQIKPDGMNWVWCDNGELVTNWQQYKWET